MGPFLRPSEGVQAANGPADIRPLFCPLRSRTSHHAGRGNRGPPAAAGASLGPPARARHRAGARPLVCLGPARVAENARRRISRRGGHRGARPLPCVPCGQAAGAKQHKGTHDRNTRRDSLADCGHGRHRQHLQQPGSSRARAFFDASMVHCGRGPCKTSRRVSRCPSLKLYLTTSK